jgi:hypothetical protein
VPRQAILYRLGSGFLDEFLSSANVMAKGYFYQWPHSMSRLSRGAVYVDLWKNYLPFQ